MLGVDREGNTQQSLSGLGGDEVELVEGACSMKGNGACITRLDSQSPATDCLNSIDLRLAGPTWL